jgi:hypothetical protein
MSLSVLLISDNGNLAISSSKASASASSNVIPWTCSRISSVRLVKLVWYWEETLRDYWYGHMQPWIQFNIKKYVSCNDKYWNPHNKKWDNEVYSIFSDQVKQHHYWKSLSSWPPFQNGRLECPSVTEISIFKVQNVPNIRRVHGKV